MLILYCYALFECSIPVFEGLLPEPHNSTILRLLFLCNHWHGLAKLRMHTDHTLDILDQTTICLGTEFRAFSDKTCSRFSTRELSREGQARKCRKAKTATTKRSDGPQSKSFNLQTYKYHSLGDYVKMIRQFGTMDSFSMEPVSFSLSLVIFGF